MKDMNERGTENELKGAAKEMKGKVKGDLGDAMDDGSTHASGRMEEMQGKVQKNLGKAERAMDPDNMDRDRDLDRDER
jgi:uncharacterized protein YjbJ (UPF0337 family)